MTAGPPATTAQAASGVASVDPIGDSLVGQIDRMPGGGPLGQFGTVVLPAGSEVVGGAGLEEWDESGPILSPTKDLALVSVRVNGRLLALVLRTVQVGDPPTVVVTSWTDFTEDQAVEFSVYFSAGDCDTPGDIKQQVFGVVALPPTKKAKVVRAWSVDFAAERLVPADPATLDCTVPGG